MTIQTTAATNPRHKCLEGKRETTTPLDSINCWNQLLPHLFGTPPSKMGIIADDYSNHRCYNPEA